MADERELQEVGTDPGGTGEEIQESVLTDALAISGGVGGGIGGLAGIGSLFYARAQYRLAVQDHDAEREALRAELAAQYEADRRALEIEYRALHAELYGLEALDRFDGFDVEDDEFRGFGVE